MEKNPPFGIFFTLIFLWEGDCLFFSLLKLAPQMLTPSSISYNVVAYLLFQVHYFDCRSPYLVNKSALRLNSHSKFCSSRTHADTCEGRDFPLNHLQYVKIPVKINLDQSMQRNSKEGDVILATSVYIRMIYWPIFAL